MYSFHPTYHLKGIVSVTSLLCLSPPRDMHRVLIYILKVIEIEGKITFVLHVQWLPVEHLLYTNGRVLIESDIIIKITSHP